MITVCNAAAYIGVIYGVINRASENMCISIMHWMKFLCIRLLSEHRTCWKLHQNIELVLYKASLRDIGNSPVASSGLILWSRSQNVMRENKASKHRLHINFGIFPVCKAYLPVKPAELSNACSLRQGRVWVTASIVRALKCYICTNHFTRSEFCIMWLFPAYGLSIFYFNAKASFKKTKQIHFRTF